MALAASSLLATTEHVVRRGETLDGIAARHGVSVSALAKANGIDDPDRIYEGQRLKMPGTSASSSSRRYDVGRGDTLAAIAARFGSTISALARANDIDDPNRIYIGQHIKIPTGSGGGSGGGGGGGGGGGTFRINPNARFHVVRSGESLASIAARYGVPANQIAAANGIVDGRLYANARLFLEPRNRPAGTGGGGSGSARHTIRSGETLASIAARYGSSVRAISQANGIDNPNRIYAGQHLKIPTGRGSGVVCPVAGARFMNDWGFPRSGGRYHDGNDLFAPRGTAIRAPVSGRVEQIVGRIGGRQFKLWGSDGSVYIGSHLHAFGKGGRVSAGDVIGYVGSTGNAAGGPTHLHFEIRPDNGPSVNPYPTIRSAC